MNHAMSEVESLQGKLDMAENMNAAASRRIAALQADMHRVMQLNEEVTLRASDVEMENLRLKDLLDELKKNGILSEKHIQETSKEERYSAREEIRRMAGFDPYRSIYDDHLMPPLGPYADPLHVPSGHSMPTPDVIYPRDDLSPSRMFVPSDHSRAYHNSHAHVQAGATAVTKDGRVVGGYIAEPKAFVKFKHS